MSGLAPEQLTPEHPSKGAVTPGLCNHAPGRISSNDRNASNGEQLRHQRRQQ